MHRNELLEMEETLTYCNVAISEARYVANTVCQRFDPIWMGADDPRKGEEFVRDMSTAMGLVCGRLKSAIEYIRVAQDALPELNK